MPPLKPRARTSSDSALLMLRSSEGDRSAFDKLARDYADMIIAIAYRLLGSHEEALDCSQDVFVRAWKNAARYDPRWSVATWLRRITTNLALDRLRRRKRETLLGEVEQAGLSASEGPVEVSERKERAEIVWRLLDRLPEKYRLVLVLREMEGLDIAEISRVTGTQAATTRWRLHRARGLFRQEWRAVAEGE